MGSNSLTVSHHKTTPCLVNVLPRRNVQGIDLLDVATPRERGQIITLEEALYLEYPDDAHIQPIVPAPLGDLEFCPRLNKPVLPEVRKAGYDIVMTALFYDLDNPNHSPHNDSTVISYQDLVSNLGKHLRPSAHYATRNGWRLVYKLDTPLPADDAERAHRGFAEVLVHAGLPIDAECNHEWNHIYRAPHVVRDKIPTWEEPYSFVRCADTDLKTSTIPRRGPMPRMTRVGKIEEWEGDMPTEQEVFTILGYRGETDFSRCARKAIRGKGSYGVCFEEKPIGKAGNRDNQLFGYVRQIFEQLFEDSRDHATPDNVFALLYKPCGLLSPDRHKEHEKLWDKVLREWRHQAGKQQAIDEQPNEILEMMRKIYGSQIPEDEDEALAYIKHRLIAVHQRDIYLLNQFTGYYNPYPYQSNMIAAGLIEQGIDTIVPYQKITKTGVRSIRPLNEIFENHSVEVQEVTLKPTDKPTAGGWLVGNNLVLPAYWLRTELGAEFSQEVDEWYRLLFGKEYSLAERWIAGALSINAGPIAAMMLIGAPSSGKGMFVQGLAECFSNDVVVDGHMEVGPYQTGAETSSPIMNFDESLPDVTDFSAIFRKAVGGSVRTINEKFKPMRKFEAFPRIVFTMNNEEAIIDIASRTRVMSLSDVGAISERLLILEANKRAADWLDQRGGWKLTAGWVDSPTTPTKRIIARHNLWIWENKKSPPDSRFLVTGNARERIQTEMATRTGVASEVVKALIGYIQSMKKRHAKDRKYFVRDEQGVFVTTNSIVRFVETNLNMFQRKLTDKSVAQVFKLNGLKQSENATRKRTQTGDRLRYRWWKVNLEHLIDYAKEIGLDFDHLEQLSRK